MRFVSFAVVLTVIFAEARLDIWKDFSLFQRAVIDFIFPKDPNIVRVRNSEQARTTGKVSTLDFIGLVERHGYPAEEHYVTTKDGYNLLVHRIPGSPVSNNRQMKKVVFLQHGIICTSDCWVLFGPGKDLAFLLADEGYDVWLGNFRGNSYCRSHVTMSPRDSDFWQFSYHESGVQDLPAMIDYVLNHTGRKTLRYIGHSMGTSTLFVLLSMRPEYNTKINFAICLAPIAFWIEYPIVFGNILDNALQIKQFFNNNGIYEVASLSSLTITTGRTLCADKAITQPICVAIIFVLAGSDPQQLNTTALPNILSHYPCGTSVKTLYHYTQNVLTKKFESYDYGPLDNYERYKQRTPITYDLKKITAPLALLSGASDVLATRTNVLRVYRQLPNVVVLEENPYKSFNHLDFMWAIDAKTLIFDRIMELLQKFDTESNRYYLF
ncbi:hypothetical protein DMN91_006684 [Ooceraea biroi]|uniref:Lipase n=1 Tax=Ooceraea biroi TaxID=2015173 RepID=A0A026WHT3_OOCBI|nr:lipase 3 [Ooceraea biroi]EZA54629.1 Lipase [Ooceraea biroi]RLU20078.1 hypothetical protein DMN91_006684 [Ooceraea biroi]